MSDEVSLSGRPQVGLRTAFLVGHQIAEIVLFEKLGRAIWEQHVQDLQVSYLFL